MSDGWRAYVPLRDEVAEQRVIRTVPWVANRAASRSAEPPPREAAEHGRRKTGRRSAGAA
jgi:hypothetical protein